MQSVNLFVNATIQIVLFSTIPFLWWVIRDRKHSSFLPWIGIVKPIIKDRRAFLLVFLLFFLSFAVLPMFVKDVDMATSQFEGQGLSALIPALIYAFLQTGFSEELFFRGFLTKRLVAKFGFKLGNAIQAFVFGIIHGAMFLSLTGILGAAAIILMTAAIGWLLGWINERQSGGSILPSWLIHGCANTLVSIISAFNIL